MHSPTNFKFIKIVFKEIYCEGVDQIGIGTINGHLWKEH